MNRRVNFARRLGALLVPLMVLTASLLQGPLQPMTASAQSTPTVTDIFPTDGPVNGGTLVYIIGTGFTINGDGVNSAVSGVFFGGRAATVVSVDSDNQMKVTSPNNTVSAGGSGPGAAHVVVTTTGGTVQSPKDFVYHPEITAVTPNAGLVSGHDHTVTLTGVGFEYKNGTATVSTGQTVCFGQNGSGSFKSCNTATVCPATTPPDTGCGTAAAPNDTSLTVDPPQAPNGNPGTVDVYITVNGVVSDINANTDGYTYVTPTPPPPSSQPAISNMDTSCCSKGNTVTITGTNFNGVDKVSFGNPTCSQSVDVAAFQVTVPGTQITAVAPAHGAGTIDVAVHSTSAGAANGGWSSCVAADKYTYDVPTVTGLTADHGPTAGGTAVGIDGNVGTEDFKPDDTSVIFDTTPACSNPHCTLTADGPSGHQRIHVTSPPHVVGTIHVHVVNASGSSANNGSSDSFTYIAPTPAITSVSPNRGPASGGDVVTITGTGFSFADFVSVGDPSVAANHVACPSASCQVNGDTSVVFHTPLHAPGTVDLHVHTGGGSSPTTTADQYTFAPAPTVTAVNPTSGPSSGGTSVVITGTGFHGGTGNSGSCDISSVKFGSAFAATPTSCTDTSATVSSPPQSAGDADTVDVRVTTNHGGISATSAADHFTYTRARAMIGGKGTDGHLWVNPGSGWQTRGGGLIAAPALVGIHQSNNSVVPLYIVTSNDHNLWVRNDTSNWQPLDSNGPVYCNGSPGAALHGSTLYVACQGGDGALWYASTPAPTGTALPVFAAGSWHPGGGRLSAGPALADVNGTMTFFANGTDGVIYTEPAGSNNAFVATNWRCVGAPAAGTQGSKTYFASTAGDNQLWYATCTTTCTGVSAIALGGVLVGSPAVSANTGATRFFGEGQDGAVWEITLGVGTWSSDGGIVVGGVGATPL